MEFTLPLPNSPDHTAASNKNWQHMKQRFKDHIFLKHKDRNAPTGRAASLLMFINGDKIRDVMKSWSSDANHKTDVLDDAFENIEDLCLPSFILLYERFKFFSIRQKRCTDLRKFVSELEILADLCELHDLRQKYVTDRLVDGIRSQALRERLRGISDLELQQALEICEKAQGHRIKTYVDVACKEVSGENEVVRGQPRTARRKRGIVNGNSSVFKKMCNINEKKSSVKKKNGSVINKMCNVNEKKSSVKKKNGSVIKKICNVNEKKSSVKEKNGRQKSKLIDDPLQRSVQTKPRRIRSARTRTANVAVVSKPADRTEAVSVEAASPSSCPTSTLRKRLNTSLTKHAHSIKTLRTRQIRKSSAQSLVPKLNEESHGVKTLTTREAVISFRPDISTSTPDKPMLPERKERTTPGKHVGVDPASRDAIDNDVYSVSNFKESQISGREEISVKYSQVDYFMDLKSEPENPNPCQQNTDTISQNKQTRKLRKCPVEERGFRAPCESECQSRSHLDQKVDISSVGDVDIISSDSLSRHMKQTHLNLLTFHCDKCDVLFECQGALDRHRSALCSTEPHSTEPHSTEPHSTDHNITCRDCGVSVASTRHYYQHRKKEHKNLRCDQCGLGFPFPSKLKLHLMSKHNATKPFMCEICGSSFAEKNMLATHKNIHSGEKKHECPTCGCRFLLKTTLSNHLQTHLDRRPHTCHVCGLGFKLSYYLKSHMKTHCENRERPHICSKCGAAFLKLAQLKNHERKHTGEKPYRCHVCGTHFSQLSSMNKHIKHIHEGVKLTDRFSCEYCGLSFTHSCKLKLHLMKHTGERPFACQVCGSTYREKHQLNTHMKIHSGSEPFKCPFCARRFLQKSSLEGHVRKHTGEKPFQCHVCSQNFSHKGYLRDHIKVHDENRERKYKCSICDKAFTCSSHMRSHEKLHSGDKPHTCDICGSRFTKRSSVKKHLKRTHGIHDATAIQAQSSSIGSDASGDAASAAGIILSNIQPIDVSGQMKQPTEAQPVLQHQTQMNTQAHTQAQTDPQTDRSVELRPVESVETPLQNHPELHFPHIRSVIRPAALSDIHPPPQPGMCAELQTGHPSLPHQVHQHPSIQILHPGLHTTLHVHRGAQIIPCVTSTLSTQMQQSEHIQDMLVYTLAT